MAGSLNYGAPSVRGAFTILALVTDEELVRHVSGRPRPLVRAMDGYVNAAGVGRIFIFIDRCRYGRVVP